MVAAGCNFEFISIDIETTGLNENYCQVLEFAAVHWKLGKGEVRNYTRRFYYDKIQGEPIALAMNANLIADMDKRKGPIGSWMSFDTLVSDFGVWLEAAEVGKITVAGKNFKFDDRFLRKHTHWIRFWDSHFHNRILDPGSLFFDPSNDKCLPNLEECIKRAGIDLLEWNQHSALSDAQMVARVIDFYYT